MRTVESGVATVGLYLIGMNITSVLTANTFVLKIGREDSQKGLCLMSDFTGNRERELAKSCQTRLACGPATGSHAGEDRRRLIAQPSRNGMCNEPAGGPFNSLCSGQLCPNRAETGGDSGSSDRPITPIRTGLCNKRKRRPSTLRLLSLISAGDSILAFVPRVTPSLPAVL